MGRHRIRAEGVSAAQCKAYNVDRLQTKARKRITRLERKSVRKLIRAEDKQTKKPLLKARWTPRVKKRGSKLNKSSTATAGNEPNER